MYRVTQTTPRTLCVPVSPFLIKVFTVNNIVRFITQRNLSYSICVSLPSRGNQRITKVFCSLPRTNGLYLPISACIQRVNPHKRNLLNTPIHTGNLGLSRAELFIVKVPSETSRDIDKAAHSLHRDKTSNPISFMYT